MMTKSMMHTMNTTRRDASCAAASCCAAASYTVTASLMGTSGLVSIIILLSLIVLALICHTPMAPIVAV